MTHLLMLLNLASPAHAQESTEEEPPADAPQVWGLAATRRHQTRRSPGVALALSLTGTVGSGLLAIAPTAGWLPEPAFYAGLGGLVVAPSLGHLYTGERDRAYFTSSLRLISAGIGVGGAFADPSNPASDLTALGDLDTAGDWMMLGSGVLLVGLSVYDIVDSPFSAWRVSPRSISLAPSGVTVSGQW